MNVYLILTSWLCLIFFSFCSNVLAVHFFSANLSIFLIWRDTYLGQITYRFINPFSKNFVEYMICAPNGIQKTWLTQTYKKNDWNPDNLDRESSGLEIRIKCVPAVDSQAMRPIAVWRLVTVEVLWCLPIKIPIKHCEVLNHLSSPGKCWGFWYGECTGFPRKCQDFTAPRRQHLGLRVLPSLWCCPTCIPTSSAFCPTSTSLGLFYQNSVHCFAALTSPNEWFPRHLCSLPFSAKFSPLLHQELLARKNENINHLGYTA